MVKTKNVVFLGTKVAWKSFNILAECIFGLGQWKIIASFLDQLFVLFKQLKRSGLSNKILVTLN